MEGQRLMGEDQQKWVSKLLGFNSWENFATINVQFPNLHLEDKVGLEGGVLIGPIV